MTGKEQIKKVFETIDKNTILKNMKSLGWNENTVKTAFVRNQISKQMARDLENVTSIDMKFWMWPSEYLTDGEERKSNS